MTAETLKAQLDRMQSAFEDLLLEQVRVSQQVDRIQKEQSTLLTLAMNGGATFGASDPRELMCG